MVMTDGMTNGGPVPKGPAVEATGALGTGGGRDVN